MQADDSAEVRAVIEMLANTSECNFDLFLDGARLRPLLFNSRSYTATEKYYHGFVGKIAFGRWAISIDKRYLGGGSHFYSQHYRQ